jgi:hypothetical protein
MRSLINAALITFPISTGYSKRKKTIPQKSLEKLITLPPVYEALFKKPPLQTINHV